MEASIYVYGINKDAKILLEMDEIIDVIRKAMCEDGYMHTHNQILDKPRWETVCDHELYNGGHSITGGLFITALLGKPIG